MHSFESLEMAMISGIALSSGSRFFWSSLIFNGGGGMDLISAGGSGTFLTILLDTSSAVKRPNRIEDLNIVIEFVLR